jgi:hypothetical protein
LPADEVAELHVVGGPIGESERFEAKLVRFDTLPLRNSPKKSEILPGEHALDIAWVHFVLAPGPKKAWLRDANGVEHIAFEAEEGRSYRVVWKLGRPELIEDPPEDGAK